MKKSHFSIKAVAIILVSALCIEVTHSAKCDELPDLSAECDAGLIETLLIRDVQASICPDANCLFNAIEDIEGKIKDITKRIYNGNPQFLNGALECSLDVSKDQQATIMSTLADAIGQEDNVDTKETLAAADRAYNLMNDDEVSHDNKKALTDSFQNFGQAVRDIAGGKPVCLMTPYFDNEMLYTKKTPSGASVEIGTNRNNKAAIEDDEYPTIFEITKDGCYFGIKCQKTGEYWDSPINEYAWDYKRRRIYTYAANDTRMRFEPQQWEVTPINKGTELLIMNRYLFEYAYPVTSDVYTDTLRAVFTYRDITEDPYQDSQFNWSVKPC